MMAAFSNGVTAPQSMLRQRSATASPIAGRTYHAAGDGFPAAPPSPAMLSPMPDRGRARGVAALAAAVVVMVAVQLLRLPGARAWNTVWAEDGEVYASEAYALPAWSTLLRG